MPARPFRMLDRVLRLTPSDVAASVMVRCRGSRHSVLSTSPGCGGLCIFIVTSVAVFIVDLVCVFAGIGKRDSPIAAHLHGPCALSGTTKLMQLQAGQIHIARAG